MFIHPSSSSVRFGAYSTPVKQITLNGNKLPDKYLGVDLTEPGSVLHLDRFMRPDALRVEKEGSRTNYTFSLFPDRGEQDDIVITVQTSNKPGATKGNSQVFSTVDKHTGWSDEPLPIPETRDRAIYNDGEGLSIISGPTLEAVESFNQLIKTTLSANETLAKAGSPQRKVPAPLRLAQLRRIDIDA